MWMTLRKRCIFALFVQVVVSGHAAKRTANTKLPLAGFGQVTQLGDGGFLQGKDAADGTGGGFNIERKPKKKPVKQKFRSRARPGRHGAVSERVTKIFKKMMDSLGVRNHPHAELAARGGMTQEEKNKQLAALGGAQAFQCCVNYDENEGKVMMIAMTPDCAEPYKELKVKSNKFVCTLEFLANTAKAAKTMSAEDLIRTFYDNPTAFKTPEMQQVIKDIEKEAEEQYRLKIKEAEEEKKRQQERQEELQKQWDTKGDEMPKFQQIDLNKDEVIDFKEFKKYASEAANNPGQAAAGQTANHSGYAAPGEEKNQGAAADHIPAETKPKEEKKQELPECIPGWICKGGTEVYCFEILRVSKRGGDERLNAEMRNARIENGPCADCVVSVLCEGTDQKGDEFCENAMIKTKMLSGSRWNNLTKIVKETIKEDAYEVVKCAFTEEQKKEHAKRIEARENRIKEEDRRKADLVKMQEEERKMIENQKEIDRQKALAREKELNDMRERDEREKRIEALAREKALNDMRELEKKEQEEEKQKHLAECSMDNQTGCCAKAAIGEPSNLKWMYRCWANYCEKYNEQKNPPKGGTVKRCEPPYEGDCKSPVFRGCAYWQRYLEECEGEKEQECREHHTKQAYENCNDRPWVEDDGFKSCYFKGWKDFAGTTGGYELAASSQHDKEYDETLNEE